MTPLHRTVPVVGLAALVVAVLSAASAWASPLRAQADPEAVGVSSPLMPRDQVQELIRTALSNPADTAALRKLEQALPVDDPSWVDTAEHWVSAGTAWVASVWARVRPRLASISPSVASTGVLTGTLALAILLLGLIRRQGRTPTPEPRPRPVAVARELTRAGTPAEQVVRETGVSRDVVEMMLRLGSGASKLTADSPSPTVRAPAPSTPPTGLSHLAGGAAAYSAVDRATRPVAPAARGKAPRPSRPAPTAATTEPETATLRFTYADLPEPGSPSGDRGTRRIDPSTRLGGMIGELFTRRPDADRRTP